MNEKKKTIFIVWCAKLGIRELIQTDDPDILLKESIDALFPRWSKAGGRFRA